MQQLETDYLVVGAGASALAFVDALLTETDAEVVIVDRRHRPGGHWLNAYPFVRLHQPSANYGVNSRALGTDRIDDTGPNAGFYERASAAEICDYFSRVLDEDLIASGRVRFMGATEYQGGDAAGHHVTSLITGEQTIVKPRRRLVDATYIESSIPSQHTPSFTVDPDVRLIAPNDLVDLADEPAGYTVLGAGKTAMDTINWLLDTGVDPDAIQWFRPSDPWVFNRALMQPLSLVGSYMQMQGSWVEASAKAADGEDFARRLEADDVLVRIDQGVEPTAFRGAIVSQLELEALRTIERVVRSGKVRRLGTQSVQTDEGELPGHPNQVYIDCTAAGVRSTTPRPLFEDGRITLQYVTIGIAPWSAATVGVVEAKALDDTEKNLLCPTVIFTGRTTDLPKLAYSGMSGIVARGAHPDLSGWNEASRLNPASGAANHLDDARVGTAFTRIGTHFGGAMTNLARLAGAPG